jgi:hypothetical protein
MLGKPLQQHWLRVLHSTVETELGKELGAGTGYFVW